MCVSGRERGVPVREMEGACVGEPFAAPGWILEEEGMPDEIVDVDEDAAEITLFEEIW